jgi:hypothetical protein
MPRTGSLRHIQFDLPRDDCSLRDRILVVSAVEASRVDQSMAVLHVEKIG